MNNIYITTHGKKDGVGSQVLSKILAMIYCKEHQYQYIHTPLETLDYRDQDKTAELYYKTGLEINPTHDDILAYQGELYLETNRYDLALSNLEKLTEICVFNCDEKVELSKAIELYESENNL